MHFLFALHDKTVFDEFADKDSGVGLSDLFDFVGVHPDAFFAAFEDFCCESFLAFETDH